MPGKRGRDGEKLENWEKIPNSNLFTLTDVYFD